MNIHESQVRNVAQQLCRAQCHVRVSQGWIVVCQLLPLPLPPVVSRDLTKLFFWEHASLIEEPRSQSF